MTPSPSTARRLLREAVALLDAAPIRDGYKAWRDMRAALMADLAAAIEALSGPGWLPIESAPRDGRELLMTDGTMVKVCYPKTFPRPIHPDGGDMSISRAGDRWEYHRDEENAPGHTWSMVPTGWMLLPGDTLDRKIDQTALVVDPWPIMTLPEVPK